MKIKQFKIDNSGAIVVLTECGRMYYRHWTTSTEWVELTENFPTD